VHAIVDASRVFFEHLAAVGWGALGIALAFHVLKLCLRTFGWRTILAAAYPDTTVPARGVLGAYLAGVGINSIAPARGGDLVRLYLVKQRIPGSTYPTLASTLVVETLFDFVLAGAIVGWAVAEGVLPGLQVFERLPSVDWAWPFRHPRAAGLIAAALWIAAVVALLWWYEDLGALRRRIAAGFAILRTPRRYVTGVLSWQAASWVCRLASVYWFLRAFHLEPSLHNALVVQAVQSLSTLLPFSPGGIGTEQGLLLYAFRGQASTTAVLSFSVGMHIALVVVNVALGAAALVVMVRTIRWRRVMPDEEALSG
jgi:uncharacterized membrane protein YbhN (UPF0104 family)